MNAMSINLDSPIAYLKGVGPKRSELLKAELGICTVFDLLQHLPFRYEDRSVFYRISDIEVESTAFQFRGKIIKKALVGGKRASRLVAVFNDGDDSLELVWFKGANRILNQLPLNVEVVVYGKPSNYGSKWQLAHPEVEKFESYEMRRAGGFHPVYSSTDKLTSRGLNSAGFARLIRVAIGEVKGDIDETLPDHLLSELRLPGRREAFEEVHSPSSPREADKALDRLRFEELLYLQLVLLQHKKTVTVDLQGVKFRQVGDMFKEFFNNHLPFELTGAQKRVLREIRADMNTGHHMNRLLQGDVGSGKTIVALMSALLAIDNGFQSCIMAPTEILARQHAEGISDLLKEMDIRVEIITGSTKKRDRKPILEGLADGSVNLLIGTHSLIEPSVVFKNLGFAVIDEQHRFGVAQRSKLWAKAIPPPHVLVMTATPIPRTLAMTAYGDLDTSVLDELPPGRKEIKTAHRTDGSRLKVMAFVEKQIAEGRQVYMVFPLIEESATMDYKDLMDGYESVSRRFPLPKYKIGIVHGRMKPADKDIEMKRFVNGETQILVSTTVIEVGVNVSNATLMIIESSERFGLSQMHQLRGRVGRGGDQSYCILMTQDEFSKEARRRLETMCRTNDGFIIAEVDMEIRGPGDILGTQQSGLPDLKMADLLRDKDLMTTARYMAQRVLEEDPSIDHPIHRTLRVNLERIKKDRPNWSRIS